MFEQFDSLRHYNSWESKHFVVFHKDNYYVVPVFKGMKTAHIQLAFEEVLCAENSAQPPIASLTCQNRTLWAEQRELYFSSGTNKVCFGQHRD